MWILILETKFGWEWCALDLSKYGNLHFLCCAMIVLTQRLISRGRNALCACHVLLQATFLMQSLAAEIVQEQLA